MKTIKKLIFIVLVLSFISCEKEIKLKLDGSEPKIVIEAKVTNKEGIGACEVIIKKSSDYFSYTTGEPITAATVIISDDSGNSEVLVELKDGVYSSISMVGVPGREYTMDVRIGNETYSATSTMQPIIPIESITQKFNDILFGGIDEEGYLITCNYNDPTNNSFLAFFVKKNGTLADELYFSNGLFGVMIEDVYQAGDIAEVELRNLNEDVYHYYFTINGLAAEGGNPLESGKTPANPVSNISNGALGCFAVYSTSSAILTITE